MLDLNKWNSHGRFSPHIQALQKWCIFWIIFVVVIGQAAAAAAAATVSSAELEWLAGLILFHLTWYRSNGMFGLCGRVSVLGWLRRLSSISVNGCLHSSHRREWQVCTHFSRHGWWIWLIEPRHAHPVDTSGLPDTNRNSIKIICHCELKYGGYAMVDSITLAIVFGMCHVVYKDTSHDHVVCILAKWFSFLIMWYTKKCNLGYLKIRNY